MLSQVAGRAGCESRAGEALLQTLDPENPVLTSLLSGDRDQFLETEAAARAHAGMPPFAQLAVVILSAPEDTQITRGHAVCWRPTDRYLPMLIVLARPWRPWLISRGGIVPGFYYAQKNH